MLEEVSTICVVVVYPHALLVGGSPIFPIVIHRELSFSVHLPSSSVTPAGSVHKSRGDNVVRMWVSDSIVVIDLPLLRVAVEGSDNPVSLEKPCQASLPPDQQGRHSLGRHPEVQYVA